MTTASPWKRASELGVVLSIVGLLVIMVVPLPSPLLSLLTILNICLGLVILMVAMYINRPLEFSVFPSLLLIMTLFDLSLHISATRLILTRGEAGSVIRGFGEVMTGGSPGVGLVLFAIITIVQFIVITKGAERVSEVTARFTLDAMPGKQMAIDADLNAGLISNEEAKKRRNEISEEANFYGAMDGASKFVKGNVIAGFIIILINIVGGIAIGFLQARLGWQEVLQTYTLLTIGEGLVVIIPSLLIAVSAAILITRAASGSDLGADSIRQLFSRPKALRVVGGTLLAFAGAGLFTALPALPFALVGTVLLFVAGWVEKQQQAQREAQAREAKRQEEPADMVAPLLLVPPIELELGYGLLGLVESERKGNLLTRIKMVRQNLAVELGVVVPPIRVKDNIKLGSNTYILKVKGVERSRHELYPGHYLMMNAAGITGTWPGIKTQEPTFGLEAIWITESSREKAELQGHTVVDAATVLITNLMEVLRQHAAELLGRQEVKLLIDYLRPQYGAVVEELLPNLATIGDIQQILQQLLRERIPIRDLVTIFEALATVARNSKDLDSWVEAARLALGPAICQQFQLERNRLAVLTLDPGVERQIAEAAAKSAGGSMPGLEPGWLQRWSVQLSQAVEKILPKVKQPVLLVTPSVRAQVRRLTERVLPQLVVLSYNEVPSHYQVQSLGMIELTAAEA